MVMLNLDCKQTGSPLIRCEPYNVIAIFTQLLSHFKLWMLFVHENGHLRWSYDMFKSKCLKLKKLLLKHCKFDIILSTQIK